MNSRSTTYADFLKFQRETEALSQVAGHLEWDRDTMMPKGAAEQRTEQAATIQSLLHERNSSSRFSELLQAVDPNELDDFGRANIRIARRDYDREKRIPADLPPAIAKAVGKADTAWKAAREEEDFKVFQPALAEVISLKRQEAEAVSDGGEPYDALLDKYEEGMTTATVDKLFDGMRPRLVALSERIMGSENSVEPLAGEFSKGKQKKLAEEIAGNFTYDWNKGRLDVSVHPFTMGAGNDVRITTRYDKTSPFNCVYSTIHEVGHAIYEQNIAKEHLLTPLGSGVSLGVHESQSRILENQLGRSRAFCGWLFKRIGDLFGTVGGSDSDQFYKQVNRVSRQPIRTEADEVHYNLHIMLRYHLERELISGRLDASDLEDAWNAKFKEDFGETVDGPNSGVLQDVHWSLGVFGYFPTYSLGNVYAGCLNKSMRRDLPGLDRHLSNGDARPATHWLAEKVHCFGGLRDPVGTIEFATGEAVSADPLLDYLDEKFSEIYGL